MVAVVAEDLTELSCVLIPLDGARLLLPNISVAEILPWRRVKALNDGPDWCLGLLGWRGETIPVDADLVIIPGSKATLADLAFLREQGWDIDLAAYRRRGKPILGICGGYQMLGQHIADPRGRRPG